MALIRWEPLEGLTTLRKNVDRLLEDFLGRGAWRLGEAVGTEPAVEISETKDAVLVKAQVPGVKKEDLQVNITEHALTLKGKMKQEEKQEEKDYYRREFRYGAFSRTISLPTAVQSDKATAQLKDGVLEVTIPKSEEAKVKEIPIQA